MTGLADHIWYYKFQAWLQATLSFIRELFDVNQSKQVSLNLATLLLKRLIYTKDMRRDHLRELQCWRGVIVMRPNSIREVPPHFLGLDSLPFSFLSHFDVVICLGFATFRLS